VLQVEGEPAAAGGPGLPRPAAARQGYGAGSPSALFAQGSADPINPPKASVQFYRQAPQASAITSTCSGAGHLTPYEGDAGFLTGLTERTKGVWARLTAMFPAERERGVLDVDAHTPSSITAHAPAPSTGMPRSSSVCRRMRR